MEYMMNNSLERRKDKLDDNKKIDILKDIARGLAYLHNRKPECIIHRDLKPSNILLTKSCKAKIADFGISCLQVTSNESYNMTGETGTYRYMAPEVLRHQEYSCKVDIWSIGMILYYMFIEIPYGAYSLDIMIQDVINNQLKLNVSKLSIELKTIFANCVKYDPRLRWDSMILVNYCNNELKNEKPKSKKKFFCLM